MRLLAPVEDECRIVIVSDDHFNDGVLGHHERGSNRTVAGDWDDGEPLHPCGQNRSTRGHAVRGAAMWRGNDHPITWIRVDVVPVDVDLDVDDSRTGPNHDVVDSPTLRNSCPFSDERGLQRGALLDCKVAFEQGVNCTSSVSAFDQCEESHVSQN